MKTVLHKQLARTRKGRGSLGLLGVAGLLLEFKHGLPVIIYKTGATPALFRPCEPSIDIAEYSTTKFLGGHGVHIGR